MNISSFVCLFISLVFTSCAHYDSADLSDLESNSTVENHGQNYSKVKTSKSNGYGEISKKTGRVKNKRVSGYTRKDGTKVKPYYRS